MINKCPHSKDETYIQCYTCDGVSNVCEEWKAVSTPRLVLDVGCGGNYSKGTGEEWEQGFMPSAFESDIQVDIRKPLVKRENFVLASGEALPFQDNAFRFAESFDVLEHVNNPSRMISEMKRVSEKILVVTPNSLHLPGILMSMVRGKYEPHGDHISTWSKAEMEGLLNRVGFHRFQVSFTNFHNHKAHSYIRLLMAFIPFPPLKYRALMVTAEND